MRVSLALLIPLLLATSILAGCLGDDDDGPVSNDDGSDPPAEGTGNIEGRILTASLDEIQNANVALVADGELQAESRTGEDGTYSLSDIEPGDYRLQVTAACCREAVQSVEVIEGETLMIDLQLDPFTEADLQEPFAIEDVWSGAMACGVAVGQPGLSVSGEMCEFDENSNTTRPVELKEGLKSVTIGVTWDSPGTLGDEFLVTMRVPECSGGLCDVNDSDEVYDYGQGPSPLILQVKDVSGSLSFEAIEDTRDAVLSVGPAFGTDVYYQQEFTVYYVLHYHEAADEDLNPIPDN